MRHRRTGWKNERQLAKIMPDNTRCISATLSPQQYPSPESSPSPYQKSAVDGREFDQMQWETTLGDSRAERDYGEEATCRFAKNDSNSPKISTTSPQSFTFEAGIVNGVGNPSNHGNATTPPVPRTEVKETLLKLSPAMIHELTSSPESLPLHIHSTTVLSRQSSGHVLENGISSLASELSDHELPNDGIEKPEKKNGSGSTTALSLLDREALLSERVSRSTRGVDHASRPDRFSRTVSTPPLMRSKSPSRIGSTQGNPPVGSKHPRTIPTPLHLRELKLESKASRFDGSMPSPMPQSIPLPPLSLPTYLQLELSSHRPSPLYIHRSATSDFPYESSRVKIERLKNFLLLPPQLEQVLWFGALACLDSWLFSFTILPLRFFKALYILAQSWGRNIAAEITFIGSFIYAGAGRMWRRRRRSDSTTASGLPPEEKPPNSPPIAEASPEMSRFSFPDHGEKENPSAIHSHPEPNHKRNAFQRHRRSKSVPSALLPDHKADILKGLLIIISCTILMHFDASRMYHGIRGQAAIKLYVIYNVLEVSV